MKMNKYQKEAMRTALNIAKKDVWYSALGLAGEAGEVIEQIKKFYRDDDGIMTVKRKQKLIRELGDVLWYLACMAEIWGLNFEDIAKENLAKLAIRFENNSIKGDGSDR